MWKDTTSHRQGDKERVPTSFTAKSGPVAITITCGHIDYTPDWVMHCAALSINTHHLVGVSSLEGAKMAAITIVKLRADAIVSHASTLSE